MLTPLLLALSRFQTFLRPCVLSRTCQGPPKSGQFSNLEKQVEPRRNCYAHNVKSCSFHIKYFKSNKKAITEIKKKKYILFILYSFSCKTLLRYFEFLILILVTTQNYIAKSNYSFVFEISPFLCEGN